MCILQMYYHMNVMEVSGHSVRHPKNNEGKQHESYRACLRKALQDKDTHKIYISDSYKCSYNFAYVFATGGRTIHFRISLRCSISSVAGTYIRDCGCQGIFTTKEDVLIPVHHRILHAFAQGEIARPMKIIKPTCLVYVSLNSFGCKGSS
jgi:hypothetical protein